MKNEENIQENLTLETRAPIVTVLGHVDHGKTTLLDKIRNSSIAQREAGGITQSIGASVVKLPQGGDITFIDTPGHAAFSSMRGRGVKIADIAILVVSCDDGVMPQTKEALEYIISSQTPFIVAATKSDLPSADLELVKSTLEKEGVILEGKGGDIPIIPVSGKTGQGIKELLEMIELVWEMKTVKAKDDLLDAYVFEVGKDKRGNFASIVVKNGKISVGETIVAENASGKAKGIFDYQGKQISEINAGYPCQIIGFESVPAVGSRVWKKNQDFSSIAPQSKKTIVPQVGKDEIAIILKAQNAGSLEALLSNLPKGIVVIDSSVGDLIESDIFLAKSTVADIYLFESNMSSGVSKLADTENVRVYTFDIIYELFQKLEADLKKNEVFEMGKAQIIASFPYENKKVAGCKVIQGKIGKNDKLIIRRGEKDLGVVKAISLKKGRNDILEVKQGEEFGIIFVPQLEFAVGDDILSVK